MLSVQHRFRTLPSRAHVACMHCLPAGLVTPTARISGRISMLPRPSRWAVPSTRGSQELPAQAIPSRLHVDEAGPHGFTVAGGGRAAAGGGGRRRAAAGGGGRQLTASGWPDPPCAVGHLASFGAHAGRAAHVDATGTAWHHAPEETRARGHLGRRRSHGAACPDPDAAPPRTLRSPDLGFAMAGWSLDLMS